MKKTILLLVSLFYFNNNNTVANEKIQLAFTQPDSSLNFLFSEYFYPNYYLVYTYDNNGLVITETQKNVFGTPSYVINFIYDKNGKIINRTLSFYDENQSLTPYSKEYTSYDHNGNQILRKLYAVDEITLEEELVDGDSTQIIYDNSGRTVEIVLHPWQRRISKSEYLYVDTSTSPFSQTLYYWNDILQEWTKTQRLDFINWELGQSSNFCRRYAWQQNKWQPIFYDSVVITNQQLDSVLHFSWDGTNIFPINRNSYTYDVAGNLFCELSEHYENNKWIIKSGNKDSVVYGSGGQKLEVYYSRYITNRFEYERKIQYYYSSLSLKEEIYKISIKTYPNPITNGFTIENISNESMKATVFSLQGDTLLSTSIAEGIQTISTMGWKSGIYLLRLEGKQGTITRKLVVR